MFVLFILCKHKTTKKTNKMQKPRIIFPLDETMVEFLQAAFEDRKTLIELCDRPDNPEGSKANAKMQEFFSKLEKGEDIEFMPELLDDDDKDCVVEEIASAIYCYLEDSESQESD